MHFKCFLISLSKQSISLQIISNFLNKWITLLNCLVQTQYKGTLFTYVVLKNWNSSYLDNTRSPFIFFSFQRTNILGNLQTPRSLFSEEPISLSSSNLHFVHLRGFKSSNQQMGVVFKLVEAIMYMFFFVTTVVAPLIDALGKKFLPFQRSFLFYFCILINMNACMWFCSLK